MWLLFFDTLRERVMVGFSPPSLQPTLLCGGKSQASGSIRCDASFADCDGWLFANQTGGFLKRQAMFGP